jgi:hypothetical protein
VNDVNDGNRAVEDLYRQRLAERQAALAAKERTHGHYAMARLAVFGAGVALVVFGGASAGNLLAAPIAAFLMLAIGHARLLNARDRAKSAVAFYERGLARVRHQWIGKGRDGADLAPESHLFAADLDLFGRGSLFELLATMRTHVGEETLAQWLLAPASPGEIGARQDAVRELSGRLDLRERVAIMGDEVRLGVHAALLRRWSSSPINLIGPGTRVLLALLVASMLASLVWWARTGNGLIALIVLAAVQLGAAAWFKARVMAVIKAVDEPAHDLGLLAELLSTIEAERFTSAHLAALQSRIAVSDRKASVEIGRLSRLVAMLASRNNVMFAIPAGLMMWATQWAFAIEGWRARAGVHVPAWLDAVGAFEALLALATFAAEHPHHTFPVLRTGGPAMLSAADVAHPALGPDAVPNTVILGDAGAPALFIVSGSNMSGKSTLLRAIGTNVVLAGMGAPVRASSFTLTPLAIGASIRVVDSLTDGRSRFMAEITRLKAIVDLAAVHSSSGDFVPPKPFAPSGVLFLLDEILSGTNSHDRQAGAEALLVGLVRSGAIGLVTTHDLALGEIAARLPGRADNVHFEDEFRDGALVFDYRLRSGVVRTSNALQLMRSIGIDV